VWKKEGGFPDLRWKENSKRAVGPKKTMNLQRGALYYWFLRVGRKASEEEGGLGEGDVEGGLREKCREGDKTRLTFL